MDPPENQHRTSMANAAKSGSFRWSNGKLKPAKKHCSGDDGGGSPTSDQASPTSERKQPASPRIRKSRNDKDNSESSAAGINHDHSEPDGEHHLTKSVIMPASPTAERKKRRSSTGKGKKKVSVRPGEVTHQDPEGEQHPTKSVIQTGTVDPALLLKKPPPPSSLSREELTSKMGELVNLVDDMKDVMDSMRERIRILETDNRQLRRFTSTATNSSTNSAMTFDFPGSSAHHRPSIWEDDSENYPSNIRSSSNGQFLLDHARRSLGGGGTTHTVPTVTTAVPVASLEEESPSRPGLRRKSQERYKSLQKSYKDTFVEQNEDDSSASGTGGDEDSEYQRDKAAFSQGNTLVFLHPCEVAANRLYTDEELERVKCRPFPSRIFITNVQVEWNTVWLRTRHTDHHVTRSSFIQVRDAVKADAITHNPPGAKYALTELLNMCYGMEESRYYSFACTLASAFSGRASNTEFEKGLLLHEQRKEELDVERERIEKVFPRKTKKQREMKLLKEQQDRARNKLRQLMHIVFSKLRQKRLLVNENKYNIYRLVWCMVTYSSNNRMPYTYAFFSFFFQVCAALYVILSMFRLDVDTGCPDGMDCSEEMWLDPKQAVRHFALAFFTACYGLMVAYPEMTSTMDVFECHYRREVTFLSTMDIIVNFVLPPLVALGGFVVVLQSEDFINCVLNAVALIFITEIDDQLPRLLELDVLDIVQGFLIDQAIYEYEVQDLEEKIPSFEFSDMHITNTEESGSNPSKGITFQPYEVFGLNQDTVIMAGGLSGYSIDERPAMKHGRSRKNLKGRQRKIEGDDGQQVANKRTVSVDCLLRKIEWQYTGGFDSACQPRIGHLKLTKLSNGSKINIVGKQKAKPEQNKPWFSLTGVYMITSFAMSDDVLRLRICGSSTHEDFLKAFKYYNLWPLDSMARNMLLGPQTVLTDLEKENNEIILHGRSDRSMKRNTWTGNGTTTFAKAPSSHLDVVPPSVEDEEIRVEAATAGPFSA